MKVLIVSDIHGGYSNLKKVLENNPDFDLFLILGDILYGGTDNIELSNLLNNYTSKIISVCGNCDNFTDNSLLDFFDDKLYATVPVDNKLFFITHGHIYNKYNMPNLPYDVYIQGHTHIPLMEYGDKLFLNPGSITRPRGISEKTYIFYDNGEFQLKSVDSNQIIKRIILNK